MSKDTELLDCLCSFGKLILMVVIFRLGSCAEYFPKNSYHVRYVVLYFHFLYMTYLLPVMYISYIILNSRSYTGVRAPKLSHRSSYIKEPFGKGLDGLSGGWMGASEGLEGGLRGLRPVQGGFKGAWEGLRAWRWLAWRGLQGGLRRASRGLRRAWRGGFKVKGASRGLEKGFKGASRGLQGGLGLRGWRGLEKGFKGASSPSHLRAPPPGRPFKPPLKGIFEGGGLDPAPFVDTMPSRRGDVVEDNRNGQESELLEFSEWNEWHGKWHLWLNMLNQGVFMSNFLICLLAYARTKPQSDIGRNRRKKPFSFR